MKDGLRIDVRKLKSSFIVTDADIAKDKEEARRLEEIHAGLSAERSKLWRRVSARMLGLPEEHDA